MPGKDLVPRPAVAPPALTAPPWAQGKPETESAWKWLRRNRHWTVPVVILPVMWAAGVILHARHLTGFVLAGALILSPVVAFFAGYKWDRTAERVYVVLSVSLGSAWLWLASWLGPVRGQVTGLVLAGLLTIGTGVWGFFWWRHKRPRGHGKRARLAAKWDRWWQSHCWAWNLGGSKVTAVWEMGVTTKLEIAGLAGRHSINHVRQVMHLIESGLDGHADIGMVRAEAVKGKPSHFCLYLKRENPLREPVEFDMALSPRSVHDLMIRGKTETGYWHTGSPRRNRFTIGETRSGKSNDLLTGLAQLTGCADDRQILIDLKGGRSARPVLASGAVDYVVTEVDEARMTLRMLEAEAKARAKHAYVDEQEQLLATDEIPAFHLLIDETHGLTSVTNGDTECVRLLGIVTSQGNGLEEYVWIYTQHGSLEESVRTEQIRGNLPDRTVYRVAEARHGAYVIPEYNKLDASKLEEKGTCYVKDGPEAIAEQIRAPHMPHSLLRKVTAQNAEFVARRPPLRLYCGTETAYTAESGPVTWQQWWDARWLRLDPAFHRISPQYQAAVSSSPATAYTAHAQARQDTPPPDPEPGTGDAREAAERIARELDEAHAGVPDGPLPRVNLKPVMAAQLDRFAAALACAPPSGISPKQLAEESGRGRTWIHQMISALTDRQMITQLGRGRYIPFPGADHEAILQAMGDVQAGNDQLYREAREKIHAA